MRAPDVRSARRSRSYYSASTPKWMTCAEASGTTGRGSRVRNHLAGIDMAATRVWIPQVKAASTAVVAHPPHADTGGEPRNVAAGPVSSRPTRSSRSLTRTQSFCRSWRMARTRCSRGWPPSVRVTGGPVRTVAYSPHLGQAPASPSNEYKRPQKQATSVTICSFLDGGTPAARNGLRTPCDPACEESARRLWVPVPPPARRWQRAGSVTAAYVPAGGGTRPAPPDQSGRPPSAPAQAPSAGLAICPARARASAARCSSPARWPFTGCLAATFAPPGPGAGGIV
jgi:hypothetical protein